MKNQRLIYPLELIKTSITFDEYTTNKKSQCNTVQMRSLRLYCLNDMGNDKWLPLNRDYKPLGLMREKWAKYEDYEFLFIPKEMINFSLLWDNGISFGSQAFYVYSDGSNPCDLKNHQRYCQIIHNTFFEVKEYLSFEKLWDYKTQTLDKDGWERNMNRINQKSM